jgi:putative ABC transport system ATP-binding protein
MGLVELVGVGKVYPAGAVERQALSGVTLAIEAGGSLSLRGPSGAGKTTLLQVVAGLSLPSAGKVFLDGEELTAIPRRARARLRNRVVGFLFRTPHLLPRANLIENVELPLVYARVPGRERRARAADALEQVGLGKRLFEAPSELTPGEEQRVALARALVVAPRILLADEPTGDLSTVESRELCALLGALPRRGIALLLATQEPAIAECAARRVLLSDGKIVAEERAPAVPEAHP